MHQSPPLADKLDRLSAAGFVRADVFLMTASHATYGGFKPEPQSAVAALHRLGSGHAGTGGGLCGRL